MVLFITYCTAENNTTCILHCILLQGCILKVDRDMFSKFYESFFQRKFLELFQKLFKNSCGISQKEKKFIASFQFYASMVGETIGLI